MPKFQPGQSGNPAGRRRGRPNRLTEQARQMLKEATPAVLEATICAAKAGDVQAQRLILALTLPRRIREPIALPALDTLAGVAQALEVLSRSAAAGELEADEARALAAVAEAAGVRLDAERQATELFNAILEEVTAESPETAQRITSRLAALRDARRPAAGLQSAGQAPDASPG